MAGIGGEKSSMKGLNVKPSPFSLAVLLAAVVAAPAWAGASRAQSMLCQVVNLNLDRVDLDCGKKGRPYPMTLRRSQVPGGDDLRPNQEVEIPLPQKKPAR